MKGAFRIGFLPEEERVMSAISMLHHKMKGCWS